jgi:hypothetical protein
LAILLLCSFLFIWHQSFSSLYRRC